MTQTNAKIDRHPSTARHQLQDMIADRRPAEAVGAAALNAPTISLSDDDLTWQIAAAVLGRVTGHPHALVSATAHASILDRLLGDESTVRDAACHDHPEYVLAMDLAASREGLTALYGLVYGWSITVRDLDSDSGFEVDNVDGSWVEVENTARALLSEHDIITGEAEVSTCVGPASLLHT